MTLFENLNLISVLPELQKWSSTKSLSLLLLHHLARSLLYWIFLPTSFTSPTKAGCSQSLGRIRFCAPKQGGWAAGFTDSFIGTFIYLLSKAAFGNDSIYGKSLPTCVLKLFQDLMQRRGSVRGVCWRGGGREGS